MPDIFILKYFSLASSTGISSPVQMWKLYTLVEQHVHSVKGRTSGFPGFPEKSCFSWLIYNIGYGKFRMEQSLVRDHGACHIRNHSHRSCIDEEIAFLQCVLQRSVIIHLMKDHLTFCHMRHFFCHGSSTFPVTAGRTCKNMDLFLHPPGRTGRKSPFRHRRHP